MLNLEEVLFVGIQVSITESTNVLICVNRASYRRFSLDITIDHNRRSSLTSAVLEMDTTNYHVLDLIGEGSYGKVYKGRRKYTGQVCVCSVQ